MADLITDEQAKRIFEEDKVTELYGVKVPSDAWIGLGALDEFRDGKGGDEDDGE